MSNLNLYNFDKCGRKEQGDLETKNLSIRERAHHNVNSYTYSLITVLLPSIWTKLKLKQVRRQYKFIILEFIIQSH